MKSDRKQLRRGRPRDIKSPIRNSNDPDNYPTLMKFLEAKGRIKHVTSVTMMKARNMFLQFTATEKIAAVLRIEPAVIERWALCFCWEEERDRRMFEQFRKVNGAKKIYSEDLAKRHERIAGSIEQTAERLLQQSANGKTTLSTKDLNTLASTIKSTQDIRRTARGENIKKNENKVSIQVSVPGNLDRLAATLVDAYERPKLVQSKTKTIAVGIEESIGSDTEFEILEESPADRES